MAAIRDGLPTLEQVVWVPYGDAERPGRDHLGRRWWPRHGPLEFDPVPFDHPLYVLFSSGTTGLPKAIVHGHGGQLIEHHKNQGLGWDLKPGGRLQWFSTTAWMMWNALVSALLLRASIVMLDGDPAWPDLLQQWRVAEQTRPSVMGVSPAYLMACRKAGMELGRECDLLAIRALCTAGSPLPADGYTYAYEQLGSEVRADQRLGRHGRVHRDRVGLVRSAGVRGRDLGPCLGVDVAGLRRRRQRGDRRARRAGDHASRCPRCRSGCGTTATASATATPTSTAIPGVWRQGDWIKFTERGSCVITGRSDATLNRGGVRLGTGEFYAVVEELPEVADSLVVHLEDDERRQRRAAAVRRARGRGLARRCAAGADRGALRTELSPRHVPDAIVAVPAIPRTLTGKKLELPVKQILVGTPPEEVASRDALAQPDALDAFVAYAATREQTAA